MHHAFKLGDAEHNLELSRDRHAYRLHVGGQLLQVALTGWEPGKTQVENCLLIVDGKMFPVSVAVDGDDVFVHLDGESYHLHYEHPLERLAHQAHGAADDELRAPMPGSLVAIHVKPGQSVVRGEALLVMESMKMETTLAAPRDGVVHELKFGVAQAFERDAVLLTLEPATPPPNPLPQGEGEKRSGSGLATRSSSPLPEGKRGQGRGR